MYGRGRASDRLRLRARNTLEIAKRDIKVGQERNGVAGRSVVFDEADLIRGHVEPVRKPLR
jgi:hypothetical protein